MSKYGSGGLKSFLEQYANIALGPGLAQCLYLLVRISGGSFLQDTPPLACPPQVRQQPLEASESLPTMWHNAVCCAATIGGSSRIELVASIPTPYTTREDRTASGRSHKHDPCLQHQQHLSHLSPQESTQSKRCNVNAEGKDARVECLQSVHICCMLKMFSTQ